MVAGARNAECYTYPVTFCTDLVHISPRWGAVREDQIERLVLGAWADLAASYAWRGQKAEAAAAVELLKVRPDFTVETLAQDGAQYSDNPTFRKEFQHIVDGARTAGLPER